MRGSLHAQEVYTVQRVVDGDTLKLSNGERVRLIGVDAPESSNNPKLRRDVKRTGQVANEIIGMGKRAKKFTQNLIKGKTVRLEFDVQQRDKYGRLLAYVYIPMRPLTRFEKLNIQDGDFMHDYASMRVPAKSFEEKNAEPTMLNAYLVENGFAQVMTIPPNVKYADLFLKLQREARENGRGLWG